MTFLLLLCIILIITPRLFFINEKPSAKPNNALLKQLALLDSIQEPEPNSQSRTKKYVINHGNSLTNKGSEPRVELFFFDPNTINEAEFFRLGFKNWQVKNIVKYRQKGGRFNKPEDLKKIYGITEKQYQVWEPYIKIIQITEVEPETNPREKTKASNKRIELNSCDSIQLLRLPGIGPWFASKIIRYRYRLGGFYKIDQLLEVKGIRSSLVDSLTPLLEINPSAIKQIKINLAEIKDLGTHPYIGYSSAKILINYRNQHGPFGSWVDMEKIIGLAPDFKEKLQPYISF